MSRLERMMVGAGGRIRTSDHGVNSPALYQLSYPGATILGLYLVGGYKPNHEVERHSEVDVRRVVLRGDLYLF